MAVDYEHKVVTKFDQWYKSYSEDTRTGCLSNRALAECASAMIGRYNDFKREMDARVENFESLELMADGEVISRKPDLPNVSDGTIAGLVRRTARNLVQHAPNVEVLNHFDNDSAAGIVADYVLKTKIIGSDEYSNDMQQNLFASVKTGLTLGFDCVVPCLLQKATKEWYVHYDTIHYRDVFPEPGAKDIRQATEVFVRKYLTKGQVKQLIRDQVAGWDVLALKTLLHERPKPPSRDRQSNSLQDNKRKVIAEGYEIVTWYSSSGAPFLTFSPDMQLLFRIEKNLHPAKWHPVQFLILEKDAQHPLGKSQVELSLGRQEFQDLMLNGAMKMWYRNINPPLIGFGAVNALPNLGPGKYTSVSNPNARIEAFEVSTQTLLQYTSIAQGNQGAMVNLMGAADQQMAVQAGNGMSATPQGVEAQQAMVDITTNNYQKAIENFFSRYCSYALTIYFQEMKDAEKISVSADTRLKLINAGISEDLFDEKGVLDVDMSDMAVEYFVRCVPGSLVELEDEKQLRVLNELFVPLSQAMPALAAIEDKTVLQNAAKAMQFIVQKQIELSGSNRSNDLQSIMGTGMTIEEAGVDGQLSQLRTEIGSLAGPLVESQGQLAEGFRMLQEQVKILSETQAAMMQKLGMAPQTSTSEQPENNDLVGAASGGSGIINGASN